MRDLSGISDQMGDARTTVIIDANVAAGKWAEAWLREQSDNRDVHRLGPDPTMNAVEQCAELLARRPAARIVAVGGGALLDMVRLGRLLLWGGEAVRLPIIRGRQGFVSLEDTPMQGSLLAVPTTLGTGAEKSRAACVLIDGRRRLVLSTSLRADGCAYEPDAYRTLPADMLRASVLEVVLRVLGPYIASDPCERTDELAAKTIRDALELWPAVRGRSSSALLRLAEISGRTHEPEWTVGRRPFSSPLWYLANELSSACGISKMDAHALLLPISLERACAVGGPWGNAGRLGELMDRVASPGSSPRETADLRALRVLAPLLWAPQQPAVDTRDLAFQCFRRWGGGLPALGPLSCDQIEAFFRDALRVERIAE